MKKIILVVLVAVLVAVGFAYAAANTVPVTGAGDGQAVISGYTVSEVKYILMQNDPTRVDKVTFKLTPNAGNPNPNKVQIQLVSSGTWYSCSGSEGNGFSTWSCNMPGNVDVSAITNLRVVAAQSN
jgi:archaellin